MILHYVKMLIACKSRTFSTHSLGFHYPGVTFASLTSGYPLCDHAPVGAMNTFYTKL